MTEITGGHRGNRLLLALCLLMPFVWNLTLLPLLLLLAQSGWRARSQLKELCWNRSEGPLLLVLAVTLLLTPLTVNPARHLYGWGVHLAFFGLIYLLIKLRIRTFGLQIESLLNALLAGSAGICLLGWVQFLNFGLVIRSLPLPPSDGLWSFYLVDLIMIPIQHAHYRVYSLFYAPPMLGVYLSLLLPLGLYKLQGARSLKLQLLWTAQLFLLLSVLILTYTRIAWIAAALTLLVFLLRQGQRKSLIWLLAGSAGIAAVSLAWPPIWIMARDRLLTIVSLEHESNAGRLQIWQRSWEAFLARWYSASGFLNFWQTLPAFRGLWPHAHSLLLQQLLEMGLLATAAWYVWLSTWIRRLGSDPLSWAIGCAVLAWLICGWADDPGFEPRNQFVCWVLLAIGSTQADKPIPPPIRPDTSESSYLAGL